MMMMMMMMIVDDNNDVEITKQTVTFSIHENKH